MSTVKQKPQDKHQNQKPAAPTKPAAQAPAQKPGADKNQKDQKNPRNK